MADTIARLIFEANTSELKKAQKELDALTKAAGKTSKEIPKVAKGTKKTTKATNKMADSFRNASTATAALTGPLNGLSGRLSFIATGLSRVGVGGLAVGAGIAGIGIAMQNSLSIFQQYEEQMFRLEALTQATGFTAGFTARELGSMADEIARGTLASAKDIRDAQGVLLTFKSISGDTFRSAIGLTQDIAAVMGTTAVSGAKQLGKALEDPATNLTALTRSGISFSDEQKRQIKLLQESGKLFEAQAMIVKQLEEQVGGAGGGGGLAAATDLLSDNFTELNRVIAEETGLAGFATSAINTMANAFGILTSKIIETDEAELARLKNKDSRSNAGNKARDARILELQAIIDDEARKKELAAQAVIDQQERDSAAALAKRDILIQNLSAEENLIKERRMRLEGDELAANSLKLENMYIQNDLEYEAAVLKYGALDELEAIRREKNRAADAEFNATQKKDVVAAEKFQYNAKKRGVKDAIGLLSVFAGQSKTIRKAIIIAETGMALADNARTTAVNMGLAAQSQLSLPNAEVRFCVRVCHVCPVCRVLCVTCEMYGREKSGILLEQHSHATAEVSSR